jgi:hypothetical protein
MNISQLAQLVLRYVMILLVVLPLAMPFVAGCGGSTSTGGGSTSTECPSGLHPYKDKCLSSMAIQYVGCTEGKGISPTTEIGGGVGGTLKVVADASVKLAYKRTEQEDTPVALEIVKDCMEIARTTSAATDPEQSTAADYQRQFDQFLKQWQQQQVNHTPTLAVSRSTARKGEQLTVTGSNFWPNEMVTIQVHTTIVAQVKADAKGAFSSVITVPSSAPAPGFDTAIIAIGQTSAGSAQAPFRTAP